MDNRSDPAMVIRRLLAAIFVASIIGTGAELLLIEHMEDQWQWVPLVLIAASIVVFFFYVVTGMRTSLRIFQFTMILFILSGMIGIGLHYQAKAEFKLEINPDLEGLALISETIQGASLPPILAPGMMIQMGMLGLAFTYKHPVFHEQKIK